LHALLDTVAFIVAVESPKLLGKRAAAILADENAVLDLSALSITEIALKAAKGNLDLSRHDIQRGLDDLQVRILPYTADHAFRFLDLPSHHRDPFDRQIIAQALTEQIPVITSDESFKLYAGLTVIW